MDFNYFYNEYLPSACPYNNYHKTIKKVHLVVDEEQIIRVIVWYHFNEEDEHDKQAFIEYGYSEKVKDLDEITDPNKVILRIFHLIPISK